MASGQGPWHVPVQVNGEDPANLPQHPQDCHQEVGEQAQQGFTNPPTHQVHGRWEIVSHSGQNCNVIVQLKTCQGYTNLKTCRYSKTLMENKI